MSLPAVEWKGRMISKRLRKTESITHSHEQRYRLHNPCVLLESSDEKDREHDYAYEEVYSCSSPRHLPEIPPLG